MPTFTVTCYLTWRADRQVRLSCLATVFLCAMLKPSLYGVLGIFAGCILSPHLFKFYAEYSMRNAMLDEAPAGIKIFRRNINNLRYADDSILMAESKEELKSLLMNVKEESEKAGLKLNIENKLRSWHLISSFHSK